MIFGGEAFVDWIGEIALMKDLTKTMDISMKDAEEAQAAEDEVAAAAAAAAGEAPEASGTSGPSGTHVPAGTQETGTTGTHAQGIPTPATGYVTSCLKGGTKILAISRELPDPSCSHVELKGKLSN